MKGRKSPVDIDRPLVQIRRRGVIASRIRDGPEVVQAVGMARVERENVAIKLFGFAEAPGLQMSHGLLNERRSLQPRHGRGHRPRPSLRTALFAVHQSCSRVWPGTLRQLDNVNITMDCSRWPARAERASIFSQNSIASGRQSEYRGWSFALSGTR